MPSPRKSQKFQVRSQYLYTFEQGAYNVPSLVRRSIFRRIVVLFDYSIRSYVSALQRLPYCLVTLSASCIFRQISLAEYLRLSLDQSSTSAPQKRKPGRVRELKTMGETQRPRRLLNMPQRSTVSYRTNPRCLWTGKPCMLSLFHHGIANEEQIEQQGREALAGLGSVGRRDKRGGEPCELGEAYQVHLKASVHTMNT